MLHAVTAIRKNLFFSDDSRFEETALELFAFQYTYNPVYRQFAELLKVNTRNIRFVSDIPFLPIEFFKSHDVMVENVVAEKIFESSGTGGPVSRHLVADIHLYEESFTRGFERFYGPPEEWIILALLPSYLERGHSSLVFMVDELIRKTGSPDSGFYLHNLPELAEQLERLKGRSQKVILIGVTYALLDFAEQYPMDLSGVCIMETGGMKGRRKEQTREAVHEVLKKQFRTEHIHSEYGMTELLSQAYSSGEGIFKAPPWMKVYRRDLYDPLQVSAEPGRGALNVIDLANLYSCCFIATQDLVNIRKDGNFEVLGRTDNADIRGCNLMVSL